MIIDWKMRDTILRKEAENAVSKIMKDGYKKKITKTMIAREMGCVTLLLRNLYRLPLTRKYISGYIGKE